MAQPTPIFVTPSTTVVEVLQLQTPYTPVILNSYNYQGQVVSVLDGSSSIGVLFSSIVVSTTNGDTFSRGAISTVLNQPQGFVTIQSQSPNQWAFLNSFPFRDQYLSAGLYTLTTSTLTTALLSTIESYTNVLAVEKLVVSGNFTQSSPITFNQTLSSFGSVNLYSSFSVWQSTFFSSALSTTGSVQLFSTLTVDGDFTALSSLQLLSSMIVSGSVSVVSNVSTGFISLSSGLITRSLEVTASTLSAVEIAGSLDVLGRLIVKSDIRVGGRFEVSSVVLQNFSTLSSFAVAGPASVTATTQSYDTVSTQGNLVISGPLKAGRDVVFVRDSIGIGTNLTATGSGKINGFLSSSSLNVSSLFVKGDFQTTSNSILSTNTLLIGGQLVLGEYVSRSTVIGEILSTSASASLYTSLRAGNLSTLGNASSLSLTMMGSLSTSQFSATGDILLSGSTLITGDATILQTSYFTQSTGIANTISGGMTVGGNLTIGGALIINSINLPPSLVATNFFVSSLYVGDIGIVSSSLISSIAASSIGTGGVEYPAYTMDMSNGLETYSLSTTRLSTLLFEARSYPSDENTPYTFFNVTSSLAVAYPTILNRFDIGPLAVTTCNLIAAKRISTLFVVGDTIRGIFSGDGSRLTNLTYPAELAISNVFVDGSLSSLSLRTSSLFTSTLVTTGFIPTSTFQINQFQLFGNPSPSDYATTGTLGLPLSTPYIAGYAGNKTSNFFLDSDNQIRLNTLIALGNNLGIDIGGNGLVGMRGAVLNYDKIKGIEEENYPYNLMIGDTLRVDSLPGELITFNEFRGDTLFLEGENIILFSEIPTTASFLNLGTTYVSSGRISMSNLAFIPDGESLLLLQGSNTIQPQASTLVFNSTLYVNKETSAVGIRTNPYYTLDVKDTTRVNSNIFLNTSTIIENNIAFPTPSLDFWLALTSEYPNLRYTLDGGTTWEQTLMTGNSNVDSYPFYSIATDGGYNTIDDSSAYPKLTRQTTWVTVGSNFTIYYTTQNPTRNGVWSQAEIIVDGMFPDIPSYYDVKYNGNYWITVGAHITPFFFSGDSSRITILRSDNGSQWSNITTGGFNANTCNIYFGTSERTGGRGVSWNGLYWVAVGQGSNSYSGSNTGSNLTVNNSILTSADGLNWSNANPGYGFTENIYNSNYSGGFDVTWTGKNWVAVGFTAGTGILYSSDGSNWSESFMGFQLTLSVDPLITIPGCGFAVDWNGSRLVAAGVGDNELLYSDNYGIYWYPCNGDTTGFNSNVTWNGSYWFASGSNGISKSLDGVTWTSNLSIPIYGVGYTSNVNASLTVGTSQTLKTLSTLAPPPPPLSVAVGDESTYGQSNTMYYSVDGSNWTEAIGTKLAKRGNAVAYGKGRWVAAGGDSNAYGASNVVAVTSTDGQTWESINLFSIYQSFGNVPVMNTVFYGNNTWLLGSEYDYSIGETILYSSDGVTWQMPETGVAQDGGTYGFAYGTTPTFTEGVFYAVGFASIMSGSLIRSVDGIEWEYENPSGFFDNFNDEVYGILFASNTWFAVGLTDGTATSILYSENASTWSNCSFDTADFYKAYAIAYNGSNLWVAGGTSGGMGAGNTLKYSGDGITWSNASNDFLYHAYSVNYNSLLNIWLATGTSGVPNSVLYSEDGSNWSFNPASPLFTVGRGIASSSLGDPVVIGIRNYYDRLEFLRNPGTGTTTRVGTPFISYTSTLLNVNNALQFNTYDFFDPYSFKGVLIATNPFISSFSQGEDTTISQTLSTNLLVAEQAFTLGAQFI
jgi:hypothetical protein